MPNQPRPYDWEDYLYPPNADGVQVLRNKLGLRDPAEWVDSERRLTALRQFELGARRDLVDRTFDTAHWKAIHRQVFQDVYDWAGEFRTVDIGKAGHGFAGADQLESFSDMIMSRVQEANMFAGHDRAGVVDGLTQTLQALNIIHPFREGNGRTQRILTEHIAEHAGYLLDWHRINPLDQNHIMAVAYDGDVGPLHDALEAAVLPIWRGGALDESPWPTQPTGPVRAPDFWQLKRTGTEVLVEARAVDIPAQKHAPATRSAVSSDPELGR